jgi:thioredoxin 2
MAERLVKCPACGTTNRLPPPQPGRAAVCGKCKTPLDPSRAGPIHVTDATFADQVERNPLPVLLDLWAEWCGPCHMLAPTIEQLSTELAGRVAVAKLNIDENPATAARFRVQGIPTILLLKAGGEVDRLVGVQPKQEILRHVEAILK